MEVTLSLPENIYRNFTKLAEAKHQRIEDVITDKLQRDFSVENIENMELEDVVKAWADEDVLALANFQLPKEQSERMSELSRLRETEKMSKVEENEFEMYLEIYNNANLRKASGIAEAVKRKLIFSSGD